MFIECAVKMAFHFDTENITIGEHPSLGVEHFPIERTMSLSQHTFFNEKSQKKQF